MGLTGSPCAPIASSLGEEILGFTETGAKTGSKGQGSSSQQAWPGDTVTQTQLAAGSHPCQAPLQRCEEQVWVAQREGAERCAGISQLLLCKAKLRVFFPQKYIQCFRSPGCECPRAADVAGVRDASSLALLAVPEL